MEEYSGAGAIVLWHSSRDAALWLRSSGSAEAVFADGSYERRMELVDALDYHEFGSIRTPLAHLAELLKPGFRGPDALGVSSDEIAGWSERRARLGTAVEFAQVASSAAPQNPAYAVRTARVLRMRAEYDRAVTWFDHAIFVSRQLEDWEVYSQAYAGLGCLYMQRGNYPLARKALLRSLSKARRFGLRERIGAAYHNLFAIEAAAGSWPLAEEYAARALRHYPHTARGLPRLARDLGFRWILRGNFDKALAVAREVLPLFTNPADRALVLSDVARASAACGEFELAEDAWAQAYALALAGPVAPFEPEIFLNLSHASISRRDSIRARMTGHRALEAAKRCFRSELLFEAEAVLDSIQGEASAAAAPVVEKVSDTARGGIPGLDSYVVRELRKVRSGS